MIKNSLLISFYFLIFSLPSLAMDQPVQNQKDINMHQIKEIEPGVFKVPYIIPQNIEHRRTEFETALISAQRNLRQQAKHYGWEAMTDAPFLFLAEIYTHKAWFDTRMLYLSDGPHDFNLPKSYSAVLEKNILITVTPEIFLQNYPEGKYSGPLRQDSKSRNFSFLL